MPGLCTCAAAIKREGLVQREGRLWLQKSGLPLQTMEEVRALFVVHSFKKRKKIF